MGQLELGLDIGKIKKSGRASWRIGPGIIKRKSEEIDGRAGRDQKDWDAGPFP